MTERSSSKDAIPDEFATIEEAAAFWDEHDYGDYWDESVEVEIEMHAPRRQWIALASHLANLASERAHQEGVSSRR